MVWRKTYELLKQKLNLNKGLSLSNDWILNDKTQFNDSNLDLPKQQMIIGLDFGTAFTKVVVGEQRIKYAVPFDHFGYQGNKYLLPSILSVLNEEGECMLGRINESKEVIDDLKMRLINRDFSNTSKVHAAAYIALLLRYVRGWILNTQKKTYQGKKIEWMVNIGLPTDSYDDEELSRTYGDIVQIAWTVSVLPGPITLGRILKYLNQIVIKSVSLPDQYASRLIDRELIEQLPEFAVQLVGYVRSSRRQEGLHMLIDVGAGTLDITTFNIYKDPETKEDLYPIFAQEVQSIGARFLLEHREKYLIYRKDAPSSFQSIPDNQSVADNAGIDLEKLDKIDDPFRKRITDLIREVMKYTKDYRHKDPYQWDSGVSTFYCGGGSSSDFYRNIFHQFEGERPPYKIEELYLETPDDLHAPELPIGSYDRLSVAYGLSYDPFDIGEIRKKSEVPDDTVAKVQAKEILCQRCQGTGGLHTACRMCGGSGWLR